MRLASVQVKSSTFSAQRKDFRKCRSRTKCNERIRRSVIAQINFSSQRGHCDKVGNIVLRMSPIRVFSPWYDVTNRRRKNAQRYCTY